jgi:hypothetical protein
MRARTAANAYNVAQGSNTIPEFEMSRLIRSIAPTLGALLLAAGSTVALADPPAAPAATAAMAPATTVAPAVVKSNPQDKVICKTETPIGSRLGGHRTCMKKSDWDAQSAQAQQMMDQRAAGGTNSH